MSEQSEKNGLIDTIKRYNNKLFGFISRKVSTVEDAEDIVQEVWYQLSKISNLSELENISGWIFQVAKNKIKDLYKKKKSDAIEDYSYEDSDGEWSFKELLLMDDSSNPELKLFKDMFWKELFAALDELPEKQKDVFILNEIEDYTLQEIADQYNENIKTIISRKGYAVKHLRKRLQFLYSEL